MFPPFFSGLTNEHISFFKLLNGLVKVDDVNAVSFGEDVLSHLRVPTSGVVAEMYAGFEKLFH